jgi:ParB-like chromosome segregation protein Spo0J
MSKVLVIDPEFAAIMPPLKPHEYKGLVSSIEKYGCLDALVVWKGHNILMDGHARYQACKDTGQKFKVRYVSLPDRAAAIEYIIRWNLLRRHKPTAAPRRGKSRGVIA